MKTLSEIINLLENRRFFIVKQKESAFSVGDIELLNRLEIELSDIDNTLTTLKNLQL